MNEIEKLSYDYMEMFRWFLKQAPDLRKKVKDEIAWAKRVLRKRDRITWWLRFYRMRLYNELRYDVVRLMPKEQRELLQERCRFLVSEELANLGWKKDNLFDFHAPRTLREELEHWMSLPIPEMQALVWYKQTPNQLWTELQRLENEWKEKAEGKLLPQEGDKPVLTFGDGWAWWLLGRGYCPEEARAMGHCGNVAGRERPYERILSLRKSIKVGEEEWLEPHLTFILDTRDNSLGEMKGRGNDKPAARYHPYILKLLESDLVTHIKGGGYLTENNFHFSDLAEDQKDALAAAKPRMASYQHRYLHEGESPELVHDLSLALRGDEEESKSDWWMPQYHGFLINEWSVGELVEYHGNDTAKWLYKVMTGGEMLDFDYGSEEGMENAALDACSLKTCNLVRRNLIYHHPLEVYNWAATKDEESGLPAIPDKGPKSDALAAKRLRKMDPFPSDKDTVQFMFDAGLNDELEALASAFTDGVQLGTENNMLDALRHAIEKVMNEPLDTGDIFYWQGKKGWEDPIVDVLPIDKAIYIADEGKTYAEFSEDMEAGVWDSFGIDADDRAGWQDFDHNVVEDAVKRYFSFKEDPELQKGKGGKKKASTYRLYHGTANQFGEFELGHKNDWSVPRHGLYFTDSPHVTEEFGHRTIEADVTMDNPLDLRDESDIGRFRKVMDILGPEWQQEVESSGDRDPIYAAVRKGMAQSRGFIEAAAKAGYDGLILPDRLGGPTGLHFDSYVAFDPKQVKVVGEAKTAAPLHEEAREQAFYHGTTEKMAAQGILQNGIQPRSITMGAKPQPNKWYVPVHDRVYLTTSLGYAAINAVGGQVFGQPGIADQFLKGKDPYGYIFEVRGSDLQGDVVPDEDSIGEMLEHYIGYRKGKQDLERLSQVVPEKMTSVDKHKWESIQRMKEHWPSGIPFDDAPINQPDVPDEIIRDVWDLLSKLTLKQREKLDYYNDFGELTVIGKKLQKYVSPRMTRWMLEHGAHAAHKGPVWPSKAWRIDKRKAIETGKIGEILEEVPILKWKAARWVLAAAGPEIAEREAGPEPWRKKRDEYAPSPEYKQDERGEWYTEETDEQAKERYRRRHEWDQATLAAISLGKLTHEQAYELGSHEVPRPDWHSGPRFKPLPQTLYHVTTHLSGVRAEGLKTRYELAMGSGHGLGGGTNMAISFTDDLDTARQIYSAIVEAIRVLTGRLTVEQMLDMAYKGTGAKQPWITHAIQFGGGMFVSNDWQPGQPYPPHFQAFLERKKLTWSMGKDLDDLPPGTEGVGEGWLGGDGKRHYSTFKVPLTDEQYRDTCFDWFKTWLYTREEAGGPMNPLFFCTDTDALAKIPESEVAILKCEPTQGAMGTRESALGEWRTYSGRAVKVVGVVEPGMKTAAGEEARIEKLSPEDVPAALQVGAQCFPQHAGAFEGLVREALGNDFSHSYAAKLGRQVIGGYFLGSRQLPEYVDRPETQPYKGKKGIEGIALFLLPQYRGTGLGRKLRAIPLSSGADYLWGQHYENLDNLQQWVDFGHKHLFTRQETEDDGTVQNVHYTVMDLKPIGITAATALVPLPYDQTQTPEFKRWFRNSVVKFPDGNPRPVYHGSTHSFEQFTMGGANPEAWYGRGFYFTDSTEDAARNYATMESPDLRVRIKERTHQIYDQYKHELEKQLGGMVGWGDTRLDEIEERAKSEAEKELVGPAPMTYKLYLRIERPVIVSPYGGTRFYIDIDEKTGKEVGSGMRLYNAVMKAANQLGFDGQEAWSQATKNVFDVFTAYQFEDMLRVSDAMNDARDWHSTNEGEFLSLVYRLAGFDGIIMREAGEQFGTMNIPTRTNHYVVWNPRQVKSAIGNVGKFSPWSPRMTAAVAPWPDKPEQAGDPWFSGSHVRVLPTSSREPVPETPLTVYHGTGRDFDAFEVGRDTANDWGVFGPIATKRYGIFFAENQDFARTFAKRHGKGVLVSAHLAIKNPFYMDQQSLSDDFDAAALAYDEARKGDDETALKKAKEDFQRAKWLYNLRDKWEVFDGPEGKGFVGWLRATGHDGAFLEEEGHGLGPEAEPQRVWVALDPSQVKRVGLKSALLRPKQAKVWDEWIGVDLDGTLAEELEEFDPLKIGKPIQDVVEKVKRAIARGETVKVFTARLADEKLRDEIRERIWEWTKEHVGKELDSTNEKDPGMRQIWDSNEHMGYMPSKSASTAVEPWQQTQQEYLDSQRTGHIPSDAYGSYATSEGIASFVRYEEYPELVETYPVRGIPVEIRRNREHNKYARTDAEGNVIRDDTKPDPLYFTDEEVRAMGYQTESVDLGAFVMQPYPTGFWHSFDLDELINAPNYSSRELADIQRQLGIEFKDIKYEPWNGGRPTSYYSPKVFDTLITSWPKKEDFADKDRYYDEYFALQDRQKKLSKEWVANKLREYGYEPQGEAYRLWINEEEKHFRILPNQPSATPGSEKTYGRPVGFAANEFGTTGVWVVEEFQRSGLGQRLLALFHKLNPRLAQRPMGQMTYAGSQLAKAHHRKLVQEAMAEGKPVPEDVLKDYPELAAMGKMASAYPTPEGVSVKARPHKYDQGFNVHALLDDKAIGHIYVNEDVCAEGMAFVSDVWVDYPWRKHGIGLLLYRKAIETAGRKGFKSFSQGNPQYEDAANMWLRLAEDYPVKDDPELNGKYIPLDGLGMTKEASMKEAVSDPKWKRWNDLADEQRGEPESAMLKIQYHPLSMGVYSFVVEHGGDLNHRMNESVYTSMGTFGYANVKDKVEKVLNQLEDGYGFEREMRENMEHNYSYYLEKEKGNKSFEELKAEFKALCRHYAEAHRALPVFNHVQRLAQGVAIALGGWSFNTARQRLRELKAILDMGRDNWAMEASKVEEPKAAAEEWHAEIELEHENSATST